MNSRLLAQQSKVEEQRALYQLRKSQQDALHVRAGIDGVLQLLPVTKGSALPPGRTSRVWRTPRS